MEEKFNLLKENEAKYAEIIANSNMEAEELKKQAHKKISDIELVYREELEKERKHLYSKGEQKIKKLVSEIDEENKKELDKISKIKKEVLENAANKVIKEIFNV